MSETNMTFEELKKLVADGLEVETHSGKVKKGQVFAALPGSSVDGAKYIPQALESGAGYVLAAQGVTLPQGAKAELVNHAEPRKALGELAAAHFKTRENDLSVVGVTGTNGKTTVTYLAEHLLKKNRFKPGLMGTVSYRWPGKKLDSTMTTPDCWKTHQYLAAMAKAGARCAVMEVSSHALDQDRVAGVDFDVAVLTNVTQDHLDYHGDMDAYFASKRRLFDELPFDDKIAVVNYDDARGRELLAGRKDCIGFGIESEPPKGVAALRGEVLECTIKGLRLRMTYQGEEWELVSPMVGGFNASNLLAAQGVGLALDLGPHELKALESFTGVPGRVERVENAHDRNVFVDYAHTPDALENVLKALKELEFDRLITVFGCGGDRDRTKRPLMAQAVAKYSDVAVLTSDNPRHEDPVAIMNDARPGLKDCPMVLETPDRRMAISIALEEMRKNDVLVVAGKGHESYQQIGDEKLPYSDQQVLREMMA